MVLILIFGVFLGWRVNIARQQRRVVAAVEKYGGWVHYDYEFVNGKVSPGQEPWLRGSGFETCWARSSFGKWRM